MAHGFLGTIGWIKGNLMTSSQASEKGYNNDNFYPGAPNIPESEPSTKKMILEPAYKGDYGSDRISWTNTDGVWSVKAIGGRPYCYTGLLCTNFPKSNEITDSNNNLNKDVYIKIRFRPKVGTTNTVNLFANADFSAGVKGNASKTSSLMYPYSNSGKQPYINNRISTGSAWDNNLAYFDMENVWYDHVFKYDAKNSECTFKTTEVSTGEVVANLKKTEKTYWKGDLWLWALFNMPLETYGELDSNECYFKVV